MCLIYKKLILHKTKLIKYNIFFLGSFNGPLNRVLDFNIYFLKKLIEIPHLSKKILAPLLPDSVFICLSSGVGIGPGTGGRRGQGRCRDGTHH